MSKSDVLYNVKSVVLTEIDEVTGMEVKDKKPINLVCDSEVELKPLVSKGNEKTLRTDTKILAVAKTPNLLYGYDFKMKNTIFNVEVASLIEGGKIIYDEKDQTKIIGYESPRLRDGATMKPFKADIYVANYEGSSIKNYVRITLNKCMGQAPKITFKKDFFAPEFQITAMENTKANLPIKTVSYVDALPQEQ
ncbi:hypothetical protein ACFIJ5_17945 (plasmid) [Haloimpatiens sp. FM7330]|uniref:hypothetical protein n=1 Tax=Haloimpatiens sp. FM7330 TaxID=3298610 RepID=UPI003635759E